jgi:hypothetical protein
MGADCSQRVCPFGLSFVDTPRGDLNHDGVVSATATSTTLDFSTEAARITDLVRSPKGVSQVQWSNKLEYEYFPIQTHASFGYLKGNSGENKGGYMAVNDEAHFYNECSGKGSCDRSTGMCACFSGYTGSACQRTVCPNDCSGHGTCMTVREIAAGTRLTSVTTGRNYRVTDYYSGRNVYTGVATKFDYNLWDADKNQACVCDRGFFGADCSLRECPRGNDPLTNENYHCGNAPCTSEIQVAYITKPTSSAASPVATYYLTYVDVYGDSSTLMSAPFTLTEGFTARDYRDTIQEALATFPNGVLSGVTVSVAGVSEGAGNDVASHLASKTLIDTDNDGVALKLDFTAGPQGDVNTLGVSIISGTANDMTLTVYGSAEVLGSNARSDDTNAFAAHPVAPANGNTEASPCSNRGLCDYTTGLCSCFSGYTTENCGTQSALAR